MVLRLALSLCFVGLPGLFAQPYADCHFHLVNFLQNGQFDNHDSKFPCGVRGLMEDGRYFQLPYGERYRRLTGLIEIAERHDIVDVVLCGMPFVKKWSEDEFFLRPRYYLDSSSRVIQARDSDLIVATAFMDYRREFADRPAQMAKLQRLHPFICALDTTDLGAVDLAIKRIREYPGVWEGLGELMSRHDDLTNLTTGERPRANHPSLIRLFKFAGLVSLPVSIHHNVAPISRGETERKQPYYLAEFVDLLERTISSEPDPAKRPKVMWCHAGISRRIVVAGYEETLEMLLQRFPENLYLDLSWVVLGSYIYQNMEAWVALINRYPDNFVIGSDSVGQYTGIPLELKKYQVLLAALPEEIRAKVSHGNLGEILAASRSERIGKVLGKGGITLPETFSLPESFGLEHLVENHKRF